MRAGNAGTIRLVLLTAVLAALSAPAHADFKRSYAKGVDAAKEGKWGEVATLMQEAMGEEGTPQARVRLYGTRFEPYVPQYYIGLAAYRQNNCATAVKAWEDGATRAIVGSNAALKGQMDSGLSECKTKLAGSAPPTPPVAPPKPPTAPTTAPTTTPTTTPTTAPTTTTVASTAPPKPTPTPTPVAPPKPTPTPPAPTPAVAAAPTALVTAIDNFLAGRYQQAAGIDPGTFGSDNRARFHALLVRAAARHTLVMTGEQPESLLAQAQQDVRTAKTLFPSQAPDNAVFSPRFRQFYSTTR